LDLDSLYDTEGLKYTGQIQKTDKGIKALYFEVKHSSKPMVVPLSHIQSLYFADSSENVIQNKSDNYIITLQGGGSLTVESIKLSSTEVSAKHPILGQITLKPHSLQSITSTSNKDE
ncbi:MAG: hypothetical protein ABGY95_05270, partial [Rubritalea sp.]|uniref:hypothetical protein n=1 Tax=Rubritalea sp. TaxID=2109375 RepID=UPI0032426B79